MTTPRHHDTTRNLYHFKETVVFVLCMLITQVGFSQLIHNTCSVGYEVGITDTLYFVGMNLPSGTVLQSAKWEVTGTTGEIVDGHVFFTSDSVLTTGSFDGNSFYLPFAFGDNADIEEKVYVNVRGFYPGGIYDEFYSKTLCVNTLGNPKINGPDKIQICCDAPVIYSLSDYNKVNKFSWSVSGASYQKIDDTTIKVYPDSDNTFEIKCKLSRDESASGYVKQVTKSIIREDPVLSIEGDDYLCLDEVSDYFVDLSGVCGVIDTVIWTYNTLNSTPETSQGSEISGLNGEVLEIQPKDNELYDTMEIKVKVYFDNGCVMSLLPKQIPIFEDNGPPPIPGGYVTRKSLEWIEECRTYKVCFNFIRTDGFENGFTSISPECFTGVPHHLNGSTTPVTVCYVNPCTDGKTCKTFDAPLPQPCDDPPKRGIAHDPIDEGKEMEDFAISMRNDTKSDEDITVFPIPAFDMIRIKCNNSVINNLELYNMEAVLIKTLKNNRISDIEIDVSNIEAGLYIMRIETSSGLIYKRIIVQ